MRYDQFTYLYPPRPEKAVSVEYLSIYENMGHIAQIKKNGTCSVIAIRPNQEIVAMNRHKETHKLWQPTDEIMKIFHALPGKGWYVFVAELLHSKVADPNLKNVNYIHDILVSDGDYLVGKSYAERYALLQQLFLTGKEAEGKGYYFLDKHTWLAKIYTKKFSELFLSLDREEDEGIVIKNPKAKLKYCLKGNSNVSFAVKCRKQHKNYPH